MNNSRAYPLVATALALVLAIAASIAAPAMAADPRPAPKFTPRLFATPDLAVKALYDAARANDIATLHAVLGPGSGRVINSGDPAEDTQGRALFVAAFERAAHVELQGKSKGTLVLGEPDWPFPFPLVKSGRLWHFDVKAGRDEVLARRVGRNELSTIQAALAYVDAQREYVLRSVDQVAGHDYAQRFVSTPDQHDGLYWQAAPGQAPSPLGLQFAAAANEDTPGTLSAPYHGYYFKMLRAQGPHARVGQRTIS
jgi:hypothetical protein